jgi:hypothetical protein
MDELRKLLEHLLDVLALNIMTACLVPSARTVLVEPKSTSSARSYRTVAIHSSRCAICACLGGRSIGAAPMIAIGGAIRCRNSIGVLLFIPLEGAGESLEHLEICLMNFLSESCVLRRKIKVISELAREGSYRAT